MEVAAATDQLLVTRCAWCERYEVGNRWLPEKKIKTFLRGGDWMSDATHGICPDCVQSLRRRGLSH